MHFNAQPYLQQNNVWRHLSFCVIRCAQIINYKLMFHMFVAVFCFRKFFEGKSLPENWAVQCASGSCEEPDGASFAPFFVQCQPRCSGLVEADIEARKQNSDLNPSFRNPVGQQKKVQLSKDFSLEPCWKQPGSMESEEELNPLICVFIASKSWVGMNGVCFGKRQWCQSLCCGHEYASQF